MQKKLTKQLTRDKKQQNIMLEALKEEVDTLKKRVHIFGIMDKESKRSESKSKSRNDKQTSSPSFDSPKKKDVSAVEDVEADAFSLPSFSFDDESRVTSSISIGRPSTLLSKRTAGPARSLSDMVCLLDPDGDDAEIEKLVRRDEDANRNDNIRAKRARDDDEEKDGRVPDDLNFDAPRKKAKYGKRKLARPRDAMPGYRRNRGGGGGGNRRFGGGRGRRGGRFRGRGGSNNVGKRHLDRGTTKKAYYRG